MVMTSPFTTAAMPSTTAGSAARAARLSGESCKTKLTKMVRNSGRIIDSNLPDQLEHFCKASVDLLRTNAGEFATDKYKISVPGQHQLSLANLDAGDPGF